MNFGSILIYLTLLAGLVSGVIAFVLGCSGQDAATATAVSLVAFLISANIAYLRWMNNPRYH